MFIGGDSIGVGGYDYAIRADPKVFVRDDFAIGYTSSYRMGQLLRFSMVIPPIPENMDLFQYMVTQFIEAVRKCLKEGGYAKKESETESGGEFLVGVRGRLFKIQSDYQVAETLRPYDAAGCGEQFALSSMFTSRIKSPKNKIIKAMEAAAEFSVGVKPPYVIVSV